MRIAGSSVQMAAQTSYYRFQRTGAGASATQTASRSSSSARYGSYADGEGAFRESLFGNYGRDGALAGEDAMGVLAAGSAGEVPGADSAALRDPLLGQIFERFHRAGMFAGSSSGTLALPAGGIAQTRVDAYEEEELSFLARGEAVTEDGRQISFDLRLLMSRTFAQTSQVRVPSLATALMDPLVVNVRSAVTSVSDQTFRFDLDADGTAEDVAMLGAGSGFLALDRDGDGRIGDGSELFGAVSGDGFGDLRAYDDDGNGWIDENDAVFSRLRIWYKNGDGEGALVDLKSADIGAVFLGEEATDFHLTGTGGKLNGMYRSTGFFLRESGGVGTVQHVDLSARRDGAAVGALAPEEAARAVGGENFLAGFGFGGAFPQALALWTGAGAAVGSDEAEGAATEEAADEGRARAREERERLREDARRRRAERKRRSKELAEEAQERREAEEARVAQLFEDRRERREAAEESAAEARDRREAFDAMWAKRQQIA